jgi:hypothetical protein
MSDVRRKQMIQLSKAEMQRLITAMKNRKPKPVLRPNFAEHRRIAALGRKIRKRIEPVFAKAGLDVEKINKILAEGRSELRQIKKVKTAHIKKYFADREKSVRQSIENSYKALQQLANPLQPPPFSTWITLDTPFLIWPRPWGILTFQHIEPGKNRAQIFSTTATTAQNPVIDEAQSVSFYFLWVNPSNSPAVVNISSPVLVFGSIEAFANLDWFDDDSWSSCEGSIIIQMVQPETAGEVNIGLGEVDVGGSAFGELITGDVGDDDHTLFFASQFPILSNGLSIAPNATAVFEVMVQFGSYVTNNGWTHLDFNNNGGFIGCPFVKLEVLTSSAALENSAKVNRKRAA